MENVNKTTILDQMHSVEEHLRALGRLGSAETMHSARRSLQLFLRKDLPLESIDSPLVEAYEAHLKERGVTRNTSSFYLRTLRSAYNQAVEQGLVEDAHPFRHVYVGIDRTAKRAIQADDIRKVKTLDLSRWPKLELSRDLFLLSFYMRGMPFVDMAYVEKRQLANGYLTYHRKKTGQPIEVAWQEEMQQIVARHPSHTKYLLPIINKEDGDERRQYRTMMQRTNRHLKKISAMAGLKVPLTTYVSRHSWASIANTNNVPLGVISQGLGHDSLRHTQIYLDSIEHGRIHEANQLIIGLI